MNARYAVIITRHPTHSEQPAAAVDDGDQDAHTTPEPTPPEPAPPSTAALRSVGDDDGGVVQEPVQDAGGGGVLGQEPSPLLERPVGGDRQGAAFVGGGDEPEQQLGAGVVERREPDLVDDDQVVAEQGVDGFADGVVGQGTVEGADEIGGRI